MSDKLSQTREIIDLYSNRIDNALKRKAPEERLNALFDIKNKIEDRTRKNQLEPNKQKAAKRKRHENISAVIGLGAILAGAISIAALSATAIFTASIITQAAATAVVAGLAVLPIVITTIKTSNRHLKLVNTYSVLKQKCDGEIGKLYKKHPDTVLENKNVKALIKEKINFLSNSFKLAATISDKADANYQALKGKPKAASLKK